MNSAVPFWFQSAEAAPTPPDPPVNVEPIGNSIRFLSQAYTNQRVVGTAGSTSRCTISMWSKGVAPNNSGTNGPDEQPCSFSSRRSDGSRKFRFTNTDIFITNNNGGSVFASATGANAVRWIDNNGWTNAVVSLDTTQADNADCVRLWINGVSVPLTFTVNWPGVDLSIFTQGNTMNVFGGWGNNNPGSGFNQSVGYHTEFRIVDGQALDQNAFGVYNEDGIWSPRPEDEVNTRVGDYGTNGAYLGFEAPNVRTDQANTAQAIFRDTAPIDTNHSAANNFTGAVNGGTFRISPATVFSDNLFTGANGSTGFDFAARDTNFAAAPNAPVAGFDNNNGTFVFAQQNQSINFVCDFNGVTEIMVRTDTTQTYSFAINETPVTVTRTVVGPAAEQVLDLPAGFNGNLTLLSIRGSSLTMTPGFSGIFIGGMQLVDGLFQQEVDWTQDSPSNNFALINIQCTDANVQTVESGNCSFLGNSATFNLNTNVGDVPDKFYFETNNAVTAGVGNAGSIAFGFGTEDEQNADVGLSLNVESLNTRANNGGQFGVAVDMTAGGTGATTTGAVFVFDRTDGVWLDGDAANPTDPNINGGNSNAIAQFTYNEDLSKTLFVRSLNGAVNNCNTFYNFGQFGFFQAPPATYATGLLATSIPNPTVADGSDGFRALRATGPSILTVAQGNANDQNGSTGFASGMWWIKNVGDTNRWQYLDNFTISGLDTTENCWITPNTTTGAPYVAPANGSVAYCHSTTETWTAAGIGEGFRNPTTQFSMLTYTGDGSTTRDVAHGLNSAPGMIWLYNPNGGDVKVFMSGLQGDGTATNNLILNTSEAANNQFSAGIIHRPNATTFRPGLSSAGDANVNGINNVGDIYRAYCWASVPGYSAFGSFRSAGIGGPGVTNGAFIYTGFAPRVVIIKSNGTDNWTVLDTVQNEFNQADNNPQEFLIFNEINAATTIGGNSLIQIRFLSNGFKIIGSNGQIGNTTNLPGAMYAAFASSPFGGGNVQPGTSQLQAPQATPSTGGGLITNSLRFRGTQFLQSETATVQAVFTISFWVKFSTTATDNQSLFGNDNSLLGYKLSSPNSGTPTALFTRDSSGNFFFGDGALRDPAAWYNIVIQNNNGTSTAFVNGVQLPNNVTTFTRQGVLLIGTGQTTLDEVFIGYLADYYCAEQILAPTAFGNYNNDGVWSPRTEAEITTSIEDAGGYGDNGFKLIMNQSNIQFTAPPTLLDQSGQGNDFEMHNFELANEESENFDLMVDGPSTNFATLNALIAGPFGFSTVAANLADANLELGTPSAGATDPTAIPTQVFTGRKYFEVDVVSGNSALTFYLQPEGVNPENATVQQNRIMRLGSANTGAAAGIDVNDADGTAAGSTTAPVGTRVISLDVDTVTGNVQVFLNGNLQVTGTGYTGTRVLHMIINGQTGAYEVYFNGGQQPFRFTPPNGSTSIQCRNLPAATITDPRTQFRTLVGPGNTTLLFEEDATTGVDGPLDPISNGAQLPIAGNFTGAYLDFGAPAATLTVTYGTTTACDHVVLSEDGITWTDLGAQSLTGTITYTAAQNGNNNIRYIRFQTSPSTAFSWSSSTGSTPILDAAQDVFANGLWWIKPLATGNHQLVDILRGNTEALNSNEGIDSSTYTAPTGNSLAFCWNSSTAADTNNDGSIQSTISVNTTAGFSIVTWTGTGNNATIGHGLGAIPEFVIYKRRNAPDTNWCVYSAELPTTSFIRLNQDDPQQTGTSTTFNETRPTTTVLHTGGNDLTNGLNGTYVAYCWTPIVGFSSMGSYSGNDLDDGVFIYTGFRVSWLMVKNTTADGNWIILNSESNATNPANIAALANTNLVVEADTAFNTDFVSNGFKLRNNGVDMNEDASNDVYIYLAFASSPFGGSNVQPANAR